MQNEDLVYYGNVNTRLLETIPAGAGVVVEIGCGAGRLGEEYKKNNPGCVYYGVELFGKAAARAVERLDMVFCGAVESIDLGFLAGKIDCLVYGDVLEHLLDPWAVLKSHAALLKPGGKIVACIPNVRNWQVVQGLLRGEWNYTDSGQLDRTHLRFFTLPSIIGMFAAAGLLIEGISALVVTDAAGDDFIQKMKSSLEAVGIDHTDFAQHSAVSQYVLVGCRPA